MISVTAQVHWAETTGIATSSAFYCPYNIVWFVGPLVLCMGSCDPLINDSQPGCRWPSIPWHLNSVLRDSHLFYQHYRGCPAMMIKRTTLCCCSCFVPHYRSRYVTPFYSFNWSWEKIFIQDAAQVFGQKRTLATTNSKWTASDLKAGLHKSCYQTSRHTAQL